MNQLKGFYEIWYERQATGRHPALVLLILLQYYKHGGLGEYRDGSGSVEALYLDS
jgi:hypothetical protein